MEKLDDTLFADAPRDVLERAARIQLVVLDVDGVLTDGTIYIGAEGEAFKPFNIMDGLGIRLALDSGIRVAIITARRSEALARRAEELGITHLITGEKDKPTAFARLLKDLGLVAEQAAYVGDDLIDLGVIRRAGLAVAVANAHPLVHRHAHWATQRQGGHGAVREVCELILAAQDKLRLLFENYALQ